MIYLVTYSAVKTETTWDTSGPIPFQNTTHHVNYGGFLFDGTENEALGAATKFLQKTYPESKISITSQPDPKPVDGSSPLIFKTGV